MFLISADFGASDKLDPVEGWGDVPEADRPLWSRYLLDYMPWFPGPVIMNYVAPGVTNGGTRAPHVWKDTARNLHAVGFTPADYYLLAVLMKECFGTQLDVQRHAHLFELWPDAKRAGMFRFTPSAWKPWLEKVRAAESPRRAVQYMLTDGRPPALGSLTVEGRGTRVISD
ncbi:hypothetical protein [Microbacterium gubbeenense]|uniref:hypothetical protein n=1 Tax=Microbacterium gubbeenense TaxID=159896 RepID=UPI003F95256A